MIPAKGKTEKDIFSFIESLRNCKIFGSNELNKILDSLEAKYKDSSKESQKSVESDERERFHHQQDKILLQYVLAHPASFVSLWELVGRFRRGYEPIYDTIYNRPSTNLKETYTGHALLSMLYAARSVAIGSVFPRLPLRDGKTKTPFFPDIDKATRFTLVDFWFSNCHPCISEFEDLKNCYEKYKNKGFDIVGISIDGENKIAYWRSVIGQYTLP